MHVFELNCNTMHDHETESRGHVLFRVTRGNTSGTCIETRFNLFQSVSSRIKTLLVHCTISECLFVSTRIEINHCAQMEGFAFSHISSS